VDFGSAEVCFYPRTGSLFAANAHARTLPLRVAISPNFWIPSFGVFATCSAGLCPVWRWEQTFSRCGEYGNTGLWNQTSNPHIVAFCTSPVQWRPPRRSSH